MDTGDLSSLRATFEAASEYSEYCTIAVTIGVFIEFVALFVFSKEMPRSEKLVMAGATALIVLGCGGEYVFGSRAGIAAAQLQQASDEKISGLTKETMRLSSVAESARAAIAKSEAETASANEMAAKANERTAELKIALEKEIAARQPRQINPQQRVQLVDALSKIAVKGEITVSSKLFDEEAERFGKQILETLIDSGFPAKEIRGPFSFGMTGQVMLARDFKKWQNGPSWVGDVQAALNASLGLAFPGYQMDSTFKSEYGDISIVVGAKP
jgi:hypothetical protein